MVVGLLRQDMSWSTGSFRSLSEARDALLELVVGGFNVAALTETEHAAYAGRLSQWSQGLEAYLATRRHDSPLSAAETRTVAMLRLHMQNASINLKACPPGTYGAELMLWDQFKPMFAKMLEYAAIAMGLDSQNPPGEQPLFHTELGIVSALISIAGKCRDPLIRRSAIALMLADTVQEGVWSSVLASRVARRIVTMEEAGRDVRSARDVPAEARRRQLRVHISSENRQAKIFYRFLHIACEEVLQWQ